MSRGKISMVWVTVGVLMVLLFFGSFMLGRYPVSPGTVIRILLAQIFEIPQTWTDTAETVVLRVRLPRIAAALLIGGALSVSGAAYQNLFKNPLVSPGILGVSAGAGFGASLGMLMGMNGWGIQSMAFAFALTAVGASFLIGRVFGKLSMVVLVLGGTVIAAIFQALISILKYLADPVDTLPAITFWLMGGLAKVSGKDVWMALPFVVVSMLIMCLLRWRLQVLSVGEEEASTMGVNIAMTQTLVVISSTLMTAAAVSIGGIIGWVGLMIPHIARMLIGPNFQYVFPLSLMLGGTFLLAVDTVGRTVGTTEIPLGILTSLIGAPFFIVLLGKIKRGWT